MKIVKIQNEIKVISSLTPAEIGKLVTTKQNILYDSNRKPVYGINFSNTPSFTGKDATFNEVSDKGNAMLTMICDKSFEPNENAIKDFTENNLDAITKLEAAETEFIAILKSINTTVDKIVSNAKTITVE